MAYDFHNMYNDISINLKNITKTYRLYQKHSDRVRETFHPFRKRYHRPFNALTNLSLQVKKGETVGIIGRNGSGKSTLLQIVCGILHPSSGTVRTDGRISAILELGAGFNPEFTGRQNTYMSGSILGFSKKEMDDRFDDIAGFAQIGDFIEQPVKTYSSGMYVRLAFAVAAHLDPDICQIVHPVPVAQNLVSALRPVCDILIILSHLGYRMSSPVPMADVGDVELAQSLPLGSVDLIIGGHSHTVLNENGLAPENIVNGIPIVQAGARGAFLGQVDLQIIQEGVKVSNARLLPTASLPSDPMVEAEMQPYIDRARKIWVQPIGQIEDFSELSTSVVPTEFARRELALSNFITDALVERMRGRGFKVDLGMIDASVLQCGLPYSDHLTYGDCFEMMPFADTLRLYTLTSQQLHHLLTDNALRFTLRGEPDLECGFLQFSREIRYTLDLSSAGVQDITIHNLPLTQQADETFTLVTTSFIRQLAEPWVAKQMMNLPKPLFEMRRYPSLNTDFLLRKEIVAYIKAHSGVTRQTGARCDGRLKIVGSRIHLFRRDPNI